MQEENKFLGCFMTGPSVYYEDNQETKDLAAAQGKLFRTYLWGQNGISNTLKKLNRENYGKDIAIILFQFYVKPIPYLLQNIKEIENYRKNEKSIGIPIVVTDENFFVESEEGRLIFIRQSILQKVRYTFRYS